MSAPDWAPMTSMRFPGAENLTPGSPTAHELALALEAVRRGVCGYSDGTFDARCDCKYGRGEAWREGKRLGSEKTGCPEMRDVITWLLG